MKIKGSETLLAAGRSSIASLFFRKNESKGKRDIASSREEFNYFPFFSEK